MNIKDPSENGRGEDPIRSRVQWIEKGEKPTKFFYNLEKQRAKTNTLDSVRDDNDQEVTDPTTIKTVVTDFYTKLYKKEPIDLNEQDRLLQNMTQKLDKTESEQCEGPFSIEEATTALQEDSNGKSPGKDGLPPEFYKRFWNKLGTELVAVLNEGVGTLSEVQSTTNHDARGNPGSAARPTTGSPSHQRDNTGSPNLKKLEKSGNQGTMHENSTRDTRDNPAEVNYSPSDARDNLTPWRPLTVSLPMAGRDVLRQDYIQGLKDYGIHENDICCVQRTATRVMVTVKTEAIRQDLIDSGLIQIAGQQMTIQDAQSSLTFVTIFDTPYELPDDAIKRILRPYGRVKTHRRQVHRGTTIETGIRTIRMNIDKPIPSYISRVGNMTLGIRYEGQEATCKKCDSPDHKQWQCHLMRCYNCGEMGHMAVECKERSRCSICTSKRH
ncbi:hypothetical protein QZH41_006121 [Actinostola sp. cb2023]|nr:hypothetical protein QZH41_006121 [Actinostola sp. cb2023]